MLQRQLPKEPAIKPGTGTDTDKGVRLAPPTVSDSEKKEQEQNHKLNQE